MLKWIEPFGPAEVEVFMYISEANAIIHQKAVAKALGHKPYATDEDALNDFVVVHFAWRVELDERLQERPRQNEVHDGIRAEETMQRMWTTPPCVVEAKEARPIITAGSGVTPYNLLQTDHSYDCAYHLDQLEWECTCEVCKWVAY